MSFVEIRSVERDMDVFTTSVNVSGYSKVYFCLVYQEILERQHEHYKHVLNVYPDQAVDDCMLQVRAFGRTLHIVAQDLFGRYVGCCAFGIQNIHAL